MLVRVTFRPMLVSGMLAGSKEGIEILIDDEQSEEEQARAIWHETVHLLLMGAGREHHDEKKVEEIAQRLAAACPEIAKMLR